MRIGTTTYAGDSSRETAELTRLRECVLDTFVRKTVDDQRCTVVLMTATMLSGYCHCERIGSNRSATPKFAILEYHHFFRGDPEACRSPLVDLWIWLTLLHIFSRQEKLKLSGNLQ